MSFIDKFRDFFDSVVPDEADDEDFVEDEYGYYGEDQEPEDYYYDEPEPEPAPMPVRAHNPAPAPRERMHTTRVYDRDNKVVSIHSGEGQQVIICKPTVADEIRSIVDHLVGHRTVILSLESTDKNVSKHILYSLNGAAYALRGKVKQVSSNTFVITPEDVGLVGADGLTENDMSSILI